MKLAQPRLPDMVKGASDRLVFSLKAALNGATLTSVAFCSIPNGLTFDNEDYTTDTSTTVEADLIAAQAGEYTIKCTVGRSTGLPDILLAYVNVIDVEC